MPTPHTILMTGATGFLGRHALCRMLMELPNVKVIALVRGPNVESARARLLATLEQAAHETGSHLDARALARLEVWLGDVTLPRCGVGPGAKAASGLHVYHFAASLCFEDKQRELIEQHNVEGSANVVALAHELDASRFVHVSTAYTCGKKQGEIAESLHDGSQGFCNAYEQSKQRAEHLVSERCRALGMDFRVVRPSIVVGSLHTFSPAGSDTGMYGFIRELMRTRRILCQERAPVRIVGDRDAPLNLVSVDAVMDQLFALMARDFAGGAVHHLTSDACPTVGQTLDAICDAVGVPRFDVRSEPFQKLTPVEAVFAKRIAFYGSYLKGVRRFVRAQAGHHALSEAQLLSLVARFVEGEREHKRALRGTDLRARDDMPLRAYSGGARGGETVVLVNAFGMPSCVFEPLAKALSPHARVLSWCSRGGAELGGVLDANSARFERHVDDLEDLLDAHGVQSAHFVGFCTGVDVVLAFAQRAPERVQSLCAAHGALAGLSDQRTEFQQSLATIARRAAQSLATAHRFHGLTAEVLSPYLPARGGASPAGAEHALLETTVGKLDSSLFHLTSAPFRTPEALHRYALLLCAYFEEAPCVVPALSVPALVICSRNDAVVHPQASHALARALEARLIELDDGSHFSIFESAQVIENVVRFIRMQGVESVAQAA